MIARVWRGLVALHRAEAYIAYVNATGVAEYREMPGCRLSAILSRALSPDDARDREIGAPGADRPAQVEVVAFSIWDSVTDIQGFAGPDINAMVLYPEDHEYLFEPPTLTHHDVTALTVTTSKETP